MSLRNIKGEGKAVP